MDSSASSSLLQEQIAYYRARASEYDQWYLRTGRYDHGAEWNAVFHAELEEVHQALRRFRPTGQVLELASGTGWWTGTLAQDAEEVTAVDASAETLAYHRQRHAGLQKIRYIQADLFSWQADRQYDAAFFGCWLSHVPPDRFEGFWSLVRSALRPGGQVFFIDTLARDVQTLGATNHHREEPGSEVTVRYLNDGRSYRIVKVFYDPEELSSRLRGLGWSLEVASTRHYFLYGHGSYVG